MAEFKGTKEKMIVSPRQPEYIVDENDKFAFGKCFVSVLSSPEQVKANAKLWSLSYEMLEMLIRVKGQLNGYVTERLHDDLEALIKKATE